MSSSLPPSAPPERSDRRGPTTTDTTVTAVTAVTAGESTPAYVWVFMAGLGFSMFSGNSAYIGLPLSLDRPLYLLATLLLILDRESRKLRWRPVHIVMLATVLWTGGSWLATGSVTETYKAFALADRVILPFAMFLLGPMIFSTAARRDLLLKFLTLLGAYLAITGVFEFFNVNVLVWPRYIVDSSLGIQADRARGPFLGAEAFGMTTGLTTFAAALLATKTRGWWQLAAVAVAALSVVGTAFSLTRSAWVGTTLGILVVAVADRRLRRWIPVGLAASGMLVGAVLTLLPTVGERFTSRAGTSRSVTDRLLTNDAALRVVHDHPLFGIGWQNFLAQNSDWVRQASDLPLTNTNIEVHNVFLSRAAETGVIGAALWMLAALSGPILGVLATRSSSDEIWGWKLLAAGALCVWLIPSLASPNPYPLPNFLVWLIAGIAAGPYLLAIGADDGSRLSLAPSP